MFKFTFLAGQEITEQEIAQKGYEFYEVGDIKNSVCIEVFAENYEEALEKAKSVYEAPKYHLNQVQEQEAFPIEFEFDEE